LLSFFFTHPPTPFSLFVYHCFDIYGHFQVSPIEYGHVLLVPRVLDLLPQRMDQDSFLLALHMAAEANNPYFRLGYNSLGAFATINHLHFQVMYLLMYLHRIR